MQQRESAKKAAASAAVAAAASARGTAGGTTSNLSPETDSTENTRRNPVAQTASWLDRAKSALKEPSQNMSDDEQAKDLKNQIQEVQRLIQEGPVVQQTSSVLPDVLDTAVEPPPRADSPGSSGPDEPADKRLRTAEDAEALVGFLRSVRASAASGEGF